MKDYISPLLPSSCSGKNVWFSRAKYNAVEKVMDYFPKPGNLTMDQRDNFLQ